MCYLIESELIIANLLNKKRDKCTIKELLFLKEKIEENIPDVFIDITKQSIFSTLEYYPKMFFWTGDSIKLTDNFMKKINDNYVNVNFNNKIPVQIKHQLLEMINA